MEKVKALIKNNLVFIKYIFSAGCSFILDLTLFTIIKYFIGNKIAQGIFIATVGARIISSLFNYFVNKNAVFKNKDKNISTIIKYYLLVIIQMCVSGILVTYVYNKVNINATIIKIPIEIVLFLVNFFVQKYFIFNDKKINIKINPLVLSILTAMTLTISLDKKMILSLPKKDTDVFLFFVLALALYQFYKKFKDKYESNKLFNALAFILSFFMTLLYSYDKIGNAYYVFGNISFIIISIVKMICYYQLFKIGINYIYDKLCNYKITDIKKDNKVLKLFNTHPFIFCFIVMLICYIPYLIAFYPAVMGYDPSNQIREFMGMHTRYMDSVILLDPNQTITNFNPVLHTLLLGGCFKLGHVLGNDNLGLFIYSCIQITFMISILSYAICYMKKEKVCNKILLVVLAIFALVPVFPFYALSTNKDTIFCLFILLYTIKLYDVIKNKQTTKSYIIFTIIMILTFLTRNNGIYTIMLTLPFVLIWCKDKRKGIILSLVAVLVSYGCYNNVILPAFKISNTSPREMLSIPFQQTARHVKYHPEDFSDEDKELINKIFDFKMYAKIYLPERVDEDITSFESFKELYNPELSDPIKNQYSIYNTSDDMKNYFKLWFKGLLKRPSIYFDATIENIYGYFYPNTSKWYIYSEYNTKLKEAGFNYEYNKLEPMRSVLEGIANYFPYIPIIGLLVNIGFVGYIYLFLFVALIVKKEYKYIPLTFVALSFMLVNVAGPANTYFRYALPYIMTLPIVLPLLYSVFQNKEKKKTKRA